MKKQTITKIISGLIVLVFIVSIFEFAIPANAANTASMSNYYSNPNQGGDSTYKFKIKDVVNSTLLTNIVGCTGVVNKVATWMSRIVQSKAQIGKIAKEEIARKKKQLADTCGAIKSGAEAAGNSIPVIGGIAKAIDTKLEKMPSCRERIEAMNDDTVQALIDEEKATTARDYKEQCFDGIAITLAKNQLTAMTRSAMNWVNSGYGGNPFFVQNMQRFTNNIEKNVIETGTDILLDKAFGGAKQNPYAADFARSTIYSKGIISSSSGFLGGLQSSLENFVADPSSYYSNEDQEGAYDTRTAYERAQQTNDAFARDFSLGGWNGWLALTQKPQNNPLGFNMLASQYIADMETQQVTEKKDELAQNNGFLSQKTCLEFNDDEIEKAQKRADADKVAADRECVGAGDEGLKYDLCQGAKNAAEASQAALESIDRVCIKEKIITPGSLIKEKVSNYLNSPERQLELVKTINDSLNALFGVLINKLQGNGLSGLSDSSDTTVNWTDSLNDLNSTSSDGNTTYNNGGAYDGFNLTRDLGNTYIHEDVRFLGDWNASTNTTSNTTAANKKLYPDLAPEIYDAKGNAIIADNSYYKVTVAGTSKIISEGYNVWAAGDRAFWDGSKWQNWKLGQTSPIKNRGVVQTQEDYIVAAKEILKILPNVMPNLGELDYCLPGPNPSYKTNSTAAQTAYSDWVGSMYVGATDSTNERWGVKIDIDGNRTYEDLHDVYPHENIWLKVREGMQSLIYAFSNICNNSGNNCTGNYTYIRNGNFGKGDAAHLAQKQKLMDDTTEYTNNFLFDNFYKIFDQKMTELYFKDMTSIYLEYENKTLDPSTDKNPGYIKMSEGGIEFTKNISTYSDDITTANKDYADAIALAKTNIAKLTPIRDEVSGIIKAAQDRRDASLLEIINKEAKRTGEKVLTVAEYKAKYAGCFIEENIQFYDADNILNRKEERGDGCSDGFDNDLDGLVDSKDTDCGGASPINRRTPPPESQTAKDAPVGDGGGLCTSTGSVYSIPSGTGIVANSACYVRSISDCTENPYFYTVETSAGTEYKVETCEWVDY